MIADKSLDNLNFLVNAARVGLFSYWGLSAFLFFLGDDIIADKSLDSLNFLVKAAGVGLFSFWGLSTFLFFLGGDILADKSLDSLNFLIPDIEVVLEKLIVIEEIRNLSIYRLSKKHF